MDRAVSQVKWNALAERPGGQGRVVGIHGILWELCCGFDVGIYGGILMGYYSQLICGITGMMVLLAVIGGNYPKANSEEVSEVLQLQFLSRWLL